MTWSRERYSVVVEFRVAARKRFVTILCVALFPFQAQNLMDRVKASGLEFPECFMLKKHLSAVNDWVSKARAALTGSVALRDLEKLLTEADKLAVDPGPKQPELQAKMDKALVWLEKVRKAVPKQRFTRRNTPDAEAEKVGDSES